MAFPILTPRLSIRPLTAADGGDVYAVFAAPEVMRFWSSAPPADLAEQWRVSERAGDRLVGIAGLQPLDGGPDVELTYALAPSAWGAGSATEAGAAALEYAFTEAALEQVVGIVKPENTASVRVLEKLGMRAAGEAAHWGRVWARYEIRAADWRAERAAATPPLGTERLRLRRFTPADLEPLLGVFGDPEVMRYVGAERRPLDQPEVAALMALAESQWQRQGFGLLAVVERETGRLIGEAGLQPLEQGPDIETGYTLARAAWGRGYATEAARAILRWGFAGLGLQRVVAVADPANAASLRVLDRLGMTRLGVRHCYNARMVECALSLRAWRAVAGPAPARL